MLSINGTYQDTQLVKVDDIQVGGAAGNEFKLNIVFNIKNTITSTNSKYINLGYYIYTDSSEIPKITGQSMYDNIRKNDTITRTDPRMFYLQTDLLNITKIEFIGYNNTYKFDVDVDAVKASGTGASGKLVSLDINQAYVAGDTANIIVNVTI